jgi:hypothetical protein
LLGVVANTCNPSNQRPRQENQIKSQPGLQSETLSKNTFTKKQNKKSGLDMDDRKKVLDTR